MKFNLPDIRHDKASFEALARLYDSAKDSVFQEIEIDMKDTLWFDGDMAASLGAILHRLTDNVNNIRLINISEAVEKILEKNGFLTHYGHQRTHDNWGTTIQYKKFDVKDDRYFAEYIESELINRSEVPKMSSRLQKKFQESIFEIFSNAVLHSHTKLGIFSCGQFFPTKKHLDFSVADLGIGMCQNINSMTGQRLSPEESIIWATSNRNTTKQGMVPGGLGLKILQEFIDINGGLIQIISDAGYWRREKGKTYTSSLSKPFPGTVVNIEINTNDKNSYMLSSELKLADIF